MGIMKDLSIYSKNGYNYKYIVINFDCFNNLNDYTLCYTKREAELINERKYNCHGRVRTLRQAANEYSDLFCFNS